MCGWRHWRFNGAMGVQDGGIEGLVILMEGTMGAGGSMEELVARRGFWGWVETLQI